MAISPLPDAAIRHLGATLAITSPVALVKELLDNALDAGASAVTIAISPNTVDRIEVRDNGHGIRQDDFDALGRCGHTSKLRTLGDLDRIGGNSLGFRGIALASATSLAEIRVTTRIPEEPVASSLLLHEQGGATLEERKAAPIGTTVLATKLFHKYPVRLRAATKEAAKTIQTIKRLLQAYVLTRPQVKMTFRILGSPDTPWQYTPCLDIDSREAVLRVFGSELASMCDFYRGSDGQVVSGENTPNNRSLETNSTEGVQFEAFVPLPGANAQKIEKGAFLSVDSRPISTTRGTGKRLVSLFRAALRCHRSHLGLDDAPRDPFLVLNIRCPPGSYDVNVEPAKDDVLFCREDHLVEQFESFVASMYAISREHHKREEGHRQVAPELPAQGQTKIQGPIWRVDMSQGVDLASDDDENDTGPNTARAPGTLATDKQPQKVPIDGDAEPSSAGLNPWSIAAMAASRRPNDAVDRQWRFDRTPLPSARPTDKDVDRRIGGSVPIPLHPEFKRQVMDARQLGLELQDTRPSESALIAPRHPSPSAGRPSARTGSQVPGGAYRRPTMAMASPLVGLEHRLPAARTHTRPRPSYPGPNPATTSYGSRSIANLNQEPNKRRRGPQDREIHTDGNRIANMHQGVLGPDQGAIDRRGAIERYLQSVDQMPDPGPILHPSRSIRHRNPPAEISRGAESEVIEVPAEEVSRTSLPAEDTRAYLIRRQRSIAAQPEKRMRRLRTDLLPLETTPRSIQTQELALRMSISPGKLSQLVLFGAKQPDPYQARDGPSKQNLLDDEMGLRVVEHRVAAILASLGAEGAIVALKPPLSAA